MGEWDFCDSHMGLEDKRKEETESRHVQRYSQKICHRPVFGFSPLLLFFFGFMIDLCYKKDLLSSAEASVVSKKTEIMQSLRGGRNWAV